MLEGVGFVDVQVGPASDTFGDGHMAWNGRRAHALPYATNALAVCVRGEASGS